APPTTTAIPRRRISVNAPGTSIGARSTCIGGRMTVDRVGEQSGRLPERVEFHTEPHDTTIESLLNGDERIVAEAILDLIELCSAEGSADPLAKFVHRPRVGPMLAPVHVRGANARRI